MPVIDPVEKQRLMSLASQAPSLNSASTADDILAELEGQPPATNPSPVKPRPPKPKIPKVEGEETEEPLDEKASLAKTLKYIAENFPNPPTQEMMDRWRANYGSVYMIALSDDEIFIFRPIKRQEYKQLMAMLGEIAGKNPNVNPDDMLEEKLCEKCVLWPALGAEFGSFSKAGNIPTLAGVIREASNFIPNQLAVRLVRKLA